MPVLWGTNVNVGVLIIVVLLTIWWTYRHYANDNTHHANAIIHDVREGLLRGTVSGAITTGDPMSALMSGAIFGAVSGFVRALHAPRAPQRVIIENLLNEGDS